MAAEHASNVSCPDVPRFFLRFVYQVEPVTCIGPNCAIITNLNLVQLYNGNNA